MSFENRFVVDLFVKLSPFVDRLADNHVLADQPQHEDSIPDLCLKLTLIKEPVRIEAKWVEQTQATNVTLTKKQIRSWRSLPTANNWTPYIWVARRAKLQRFFLIPWQTMAPVLVQAAEEIGPKEEGEDRYWQIQLPGSDLTEVEFWREFWKFLGTLPPTA
jgi:hypothetical protein